MRACLTPTPTGRTLRRKEPEISERSGIRTRQTSGFFTSGFCINGREGDGYNTRKGKKSARLVTGS